MKRAAQHLQSVGVDDIWETPREIFDCFCKQVDIHPELDVCATKNTTKCQYWYGPDHPNPERRDAFEQMWTKPFFMNPPYSEKETWLAYAIEQCLAWGVPCIILIYAKTETRWWKKYVTNNDFIKVYFHEGRISFWKDGKEPVTEKLVMMRADGTKITKKLKGSPVYASAWLVINP